MIDFSLDRTAGEPLYLQLARQVEARIRSGEIVTGELLPPTRELGESLGIGRVTAVAAYRWLENEGLVRSKVGRGTEVVVRGAAGFDWARMAGGEVQNLDSADSPGVDDDTVDLSRLAPDPSLFPVEVFRRAMDAVIAEGGAELLQYSDGWGYRPLRETLSRRLARLGLVRSADEILIVSGAQQGLDLVLRAFVRPGDAVAVEAPTYAALLPLLRLAGARIEAIPMTPLGADLDALARLAPGLRFFLTMPTFHNPTGIVTAADHRRRLLEIARGHGFAVLEDGFEDELRFDADIPPPLASFDDSGRVLYLGTFSKGLFPGARLGWIAGARPAIERLAALRRTIDHGAPPLLQAAIDRLCRSGDYDAHLRALASSYAERHRVLQRLPRLLPEGCRVTLPAGGWAVWIELPPTIPGERVVAEMADLGFLLAPGSLFDPVPRSSSPAVRLSLSRASAPEIERAVKALGRVLRRLVDSHERIDRPNSAGPMV